jgi:hypothetical protein
MVGRLMNDWKGSSYGSVEVVPQHFPGESEESHENPVRIAGIPTQNSNRAHPEQKSRALPLDSLFLYQSWDNDVCRGTGHDGGQNRVLHSLASTSIPTKERPEVCLYSQKNISVTITVAERSKVRNVFTSLNSEIVSSNPIRNMDVYLHLFCVCVVLCRQRPGDRLMPCPHSPTNCL